MEQNNITAGYLSSSSLKRVNISLQYQGCELKSHLQSFGRPTSAREVPRAKRKTVENVPAGIV